MWQLRYPANRLAANVPLRTFGVVARMSGMEDGNGYLGLARGRRKRAVNGAAWMDAGFDGREPLWEPVDLVDGFVHSCEDEYEATETYNRLRVALEDLTRDEWKVLHLGHGEKRSPNDIARRMRIGVMRVMQLERSALRKLAAALDIADARPILRLVSTEAA